jgi:hypothetical protein
MKLENNVSELFDYIKKEEFSGWDPYDGLNSIFLKKIGILKFPIFRLLIIQSFKKSPFNLREILKVPKTQNPKGIALCLSAICNLYKCPNELLSLMNTSKGECLALIDKLSEKLISLSSNDYSGSCWGYDFDWQARLLFLFPKGTPNVVCTAYAVEALVKAYEVLKKQTLLDHLISASQFVLKDLNRTYIDGGYIFSYSPLNGNNTVYNASLLGSKILAYSYKYTGDDLLKKESIASINPCLKVQNEDGSWYYGGLKVQKWIDSYHTAYNIDALNTCKNIFSINELDHSIKIGFEFYINSFFLKNGTPKYYHDKVYPIDIHSPAQLLVLLCNLNFHKKYNILIENTLSWTNKNMRSDSGYYYYQKNKFYTSRIPYFRWSQAFMFNALSLYLRKLNEN